MIPIQLYFSISLILFCSIIGFRILKKRKYKARYFIGIIVPLQIFMFLIFFLNIRYYVPFEFADSPDWLSFVDMGNIVLITFSQTLLVFSLIIFLFSFFNPDKINLNLYCPSREEAKIGKIKFGKIVKQGKKRNTFNLSINDLERHMFVCGSTGAGKSNFLQHFLMNFKKQYDIPILLVEFKGEYNFLQEKLENLLIIRPGENFSINIFNPEGSNPEVHAERIFEIFKSAQMLDTSAEYTPQMQKVLVDILIDVCKNKKNRSWKGFYEKCEEYFKKEQKNIPWLEQTLVSIKNRIRRFSLGPIKAIFEKKSKLNVKELFERDILIDLSSIIRLGGEKEDALFFLNVVLKYLWDKNLSGGSNDYTTIRHMTIIEDAQYFAPRGLSDQTKISTYIEDIALLLRGTGECLVSLATRPNVSEEILANCGVLITFKNHMQKELLRKLLNLDADQEEYLSMLKMGYCIARVNSIEKPFLLYIPYIKQHSLTLEEINANNRRLLEKNESELEESSPRYKLLKDLLVKLKMLYNKIKGKFKAKTQEEEPLFGPEIEKYYQLADDDDNFDELKDYLIKLSEQQKTNKHPKTILHEFCQKNHFSLPSYNVIKKSGPNHSPSYTIELIIDSGNNSKMFQETFKNGNGKVKGKGKSKKSAEIDAAKKMCETLGILN